MKSKKLIPLFLSPVCLLMLTGCFDIIHINSGSSSAGNNSTTPHTSSENGSQPGISTSQGGNDDKPVIQDSQDYLNFWNPNTEITLSINMTSAAANFMNSYQSDHGDSLYHDYYVPCTVNLTINGKTTIFDEVGIREKGNLSRNQFLDNGHFTTHSLAHFKLNFTETFDGDEYTTVNDLKAFKHTWSNASERDERKHRTLFDMEKIDIKWNRNNDETNSKQAFALKTFRDNCVLAGHDTLGKVKLSVGNDTPIAVTYEIMECIDSVFIKRHFNAAKADGNLYKCSYTSMGPANLSNNHKSGNYIGIEDNKTNYHPIYDLKTNKKKGTHDVLKNFITLVNDKSSASDYKTKLEKAFDIKGFMMYESIAYLLGNFDDMRNNSNNYYLYFESGTDIAHVIPFDFDRCFGTGSEGRQDYMTSFSPESTKMQCTGDWQSMNLYWRTICQNTSHSNIERIEEYRAMYQANIEKVLNNGAISTSTFASYVNSFPQSYRGNPSGAGEGNTTYENYLNKKISAIKSNCPDYNIN